MRSEAQPVLAGQTQLNRSYWALSMRRLLRKKLALACLAIIIVMYGWGSLTILEFLGGPQVTPYGYNDQNISNAKQTPTLSHPFGTDRLGRDILTRVVHGLRTTVIITVIVLASGSLALGISMGLISGYFGRYIDTIIMRVGEVTSAFPEILLVLIFVSTFRRPIADWVRGIENTLGIEIVRLGVADYLVLSLGLAIFSWFGMARLVRGQVLQARENQYVEAARAIGGSTPRVLLRHVLPNIMGPGIVVVSAGMAAVAGAEVFLSFLGIGVQPPTPSLGLMIFRNGSIAVLRTNPHLLLFPVGTLAVLLLVFNLLGDAVNDAFNPRAR